MQTIYSDLLEVSFNFSLLTLIPTSFPSLLFIPPIPAFHMLNPNYYQDLRIKVWISHLLTPIVSR